MIPVSELVAKEKQKPPGWLREDGRHGLDGL